MVLEGAKEIITNFLNDIKFKDIAGVEIATVQQREITGDFDLPLRFVRLSIDEMYDIDRKLGIGNEYLKDIKNDTSTLHDIKHDISDIKRDTSTLQDIKRDTSMLSDIKHDTSMLSDIKHDTSMLSDIKHDTSIFPRSNAILRYFPMLKMESTV